MLKQRKEERQIQQATPKGWIKTFQQLNKYWGELTGPKREGGQLASAVIDAVAADASIAAAEDDDDAVAHDTLVAADDAVANDYDLMP